MKTTQGNIDNMLNVVKYIFQNYSEYRPFLTGSLAMYLNSIDFGEINDIDIILYCRLKDMNQLMSTINNDISSNFNIPINIIVNPLYSDDEILEKEIDGVNIKYVSHQSLYKYWQFYIEQFPNKEKYNQHITFYEEWLNNNSEE